MQKHLMIYFRLLNLFRLGSYDFIRGNIINIPDKVERVCFDLPCAFARYGHGSRCWSFKIAEPATRIPLPKLVTHLHISSLLNEYRYMIPGNILLLRIDFCTGE